MSLFYKSHVKINPKASVEKGAEHMRIKEKILMNKEELTKHGPITIVAFGDSVTHGALSDGEINYETAPQHLSYAADDTMYKE